MIFVRKKEVSGKAVFVYVYILFLAVVLVGGVTNPQFKYFALGGLSSIGYLMIVSMF